ncbi:MAG: Uma2 family endonuclease [Deltaproteobacteria bacterium]|nr:Uma2 family endonuclease [Deltaproteobacteria bacterium]
MTSIPLSVPPGQYVPTADERVVMYGVSWEHYELMLEVRGERSQPRMAYLDGALELMTTSHGHEGVNFMVSRMLEAYALDANIRFRGYGHWTLRKGAEKQAGIESDECYQFGDDQTERMPDLAIEVTWTSGGIDKLEIYRRLGVREVWFWEGGEILVFLLEGDRYERRAKSTFVPDLDLSLVARLVEQPTINDAVRELRAAMKR